MSASDDSGESRRFLAYPPLPFSRMMSTMTTEPTQPGARPNALYYLWFAASMALMFGLLYLVRHVPRHSLSTIVVVMVPLGGMSAAYWWYNRPRIAIRVSRDGLTVKGRPGVFSTQDAEFGAWAWGGKTMGTALHLRSGSQLFVLGGRDHRTGSGTRFGEPPESYVHAWLWASDFDELLCTVGRLDARRRTPTEWTRCVLFTNTEATQQMSVWALGAKSRLVRSAGQPRLTVDVGDQQIRVRDADGDTPIVTAPRAQVTATPQTYRCRRLAFGPSYKNPPPSPVLVLDIPGMAPLTIGCHEPSGRFLLDFTPRFSWPKEVPDRVNEPADYSVTARDWLTLVDEFGLAAQLTDSAHSRDG